MGSAGQHHLMPSDTRTLFKTQNDSFRKKALKGQKETYLIWYLYLWADCTPDHTHSPQRGDEYEHLKQCNLMCLGSGPGCLHLSTRPYLLTVFSHMSVTWPHCSSNKVKSMTLFQWPFGWMLIISFAQISSCTEHVPYLTQSQSLLSLKVYFRSLGKRPQIRFCIGYVSCGMWK